MRGRFQLSTVFRWLRSRFALLCIVWTFGLLLGHFCAPTPVEPFFSLMRPQLVGRVSIVSHLCTVCFPLLLAALAVNIQRPLLLLSVLFCKAFQFSYCATWIYACFGTAGWLIRFLLQFSDIFAVPVLCWFSIRYLRGRDVVKGMELALCVLLTLTVAAVDAWIIAPYLEMLINA